MKVVRSGIDRRSAIDRRQMMLPTSLERRRTKRRISGEYREAWVRSSKWSSINLDMRNRYLWEMFK